MATKTIGYLLLAFGLLLIGSAIFYTYQVFTGKQTPTKVFNLSGVNLQLDSFIPDSKPAEIYPAESINLIMNYLAFYLLSTFIVTSGFKISSLGIQLLRPIEFKLKANSTKSE